MLRLARRLFTPCSAVSGVLCVVVFLFWLRSHRDPQDWAVTALSDPSPSGGASGRMQFGRVHAERPLTVDPSGLSFRIVYSPGTARELLPRSVSWRLLGFEEQAGRFLIFKETEPGSRVWVWKSEAPFRVWFIPYWCPAALLALLPVLWLGRSLFIRRRESSALWSRRMKRCSACGYDLRASPERCPECGAAAAPVAAREDVPAVSRTTL